MCGWLTWGHTRRWHRWPIGLPRWALLVVLLLRWWSSVSRISEMAPKNHIRWLLASRYFFPVPLEPADELSGRLEHCSGVRQRVHASLCTFLPKLETLRGDLDRFVANTLARHVRQDEAAWLFVKWAVRRLMSASRHACGTHLT